MIRIVIASAIAGCIAFSATKFIPLRATDNSLVITIPKFLAISGISLVSYLIASYFLNIEEAKPIIKKVKHIVFRNVFEKKK